jgi:hypothetical protein
VNQFVETELKRLETQTQYQQNSPAPFETLDDIFRTIWQQLASPV